MENAICNVEDLPPAVLPPRELDAARDAAVVFPLSVTPYYLSLIDPSDPDDPIRKMVVPNGLELEHVHGLKDDPIDEEKHSPMPGLIHRYPDRALLLVSGRCAVNCRHCTRRRLGEGRVSPLDEKGFADVISYLHRHPEIRDVILSGGDPLLEDETRLESILKAVRSVPSVEIIRVGTRIPVTLPMRVTEGLAKLLSRYHPLYVNTQFNHVREVTEQAARAVSHLVDAGIPVSNQSVLLKGVNDTARDVEQLCRALLRIRVRPYYLFLCDLWDGLDHFRTTIATGIDIMERLRGRLSGLGIPQLMVDLQGGIGKVPLLPNYIVSKEKGYTVLRSPDGQIAHYPDPQ
jgi:lysine 2,3-aminomutase